MKVNGKCKTPGAVYHIRIHESTVGCDVTLPMNLSLTEEQASDLEDRIHDAMEDVLARYFSESRRLCQVVVDTINDQVENQEA
jgi:hypothetical protein